MRLGEFLHLGERVFRVSFGVVRADRREAEAFRDERASVGDETVDDRDHIRAVIADEDDHRPLFAGDIGEREVLPSVAGSRNSGAGEPKSVFSGLVAAMIEPRGNLASPRSLSNNALPRNRKEIGEPRGATCRGHRR